MMNLEVEFFDNELINIYNKLIVNIKLNNYLI